MECNKDEAIRAKVIAERKLMEKDFAGAKKFVLKAQTLYPGLDGLSQMLTTLDVYISAENKISGEVDWYGILGVNPYADDETVKKQYRKLALSLHPDKNKSVGADGAFKLISEAWNLLSDKSKRLAYNQRRGSRGFQKIPTKTGGKSAPPNANGFHNFPTSATSNVKTQNNTARVHPTSVRPPSYPRTDTFWTICNRCKMHYEYLRVYLNHTLLCPNCHVAFLASETAPPSNFSKPSSSTSRQSYQNPGQYTINSNPSDPGRYSKPGGSAGLNSFNHTKVQQGQFATTSGFGKTVSSSSVAAKVVQQANEKLKREREEVQAAGGWERLLRKRGVESDGNCYGDHTAYQRAMGNGGTGMGGLFGSRPGGLGTDRANGFPGTNGKPNSTRELTPLEIHYMLMVKARIEICKKLNELRSVPKTVNSKKERVKESKKEKDKSTIKGETSGLNGNGVSFGTMGGNQANKGFTSSSADGAHKDNPAPVSLDVPDPDFHDFDQDRTENAFGDNQVWAAYDDDDGMPRFYALIHKVISLKPFKMRISWLNSKTSSEFGTLDWVGSGFFKTSGEFRVGRYEFTKSLNSFSHKVKWVKGTRGTVCIFPEKGDVWALYRNWAPDWNEHTPDAVIHKYDMVEVLEDYNEDEGVSVAPLLKVTGFKTVFHRHMDPENVMRIPREEMFRFSHQVPSYLLTGREAQNSPKDCLELDPAATPLELLQVTTESVEATTEDNDGKAEKETSQSTPEIIVDEIVTNTTQAKEEQMVESGEET
ncbi:uncharacterized protein LOC130761580 [Actinidia eriantha]|uniref:uncharacterized protein LOC130761580 n=1 Tax=Actinidia eriantha TaxID=165200 RepID=UPI00258FCCD1|nr:uncharacterized protein LOC130761580 [Actinidia eriantha]XP_057473089.1 uncharacterized protein LOC130761580 [Actinidia eriantha]XP_057473094.1 uncharacterized protein LOC130761580 [Actinidia eriantha]